MRTIAALVYCLMALGGCHERSGTSSITRASLDGEDTLFTKLEVHDGVAEFHCLVSTSGHCHYLVYAEDCRDGQCRRVTLQRLDLRPGQTHESRGLPAGFGHCADGKPPAEGCGKPGVAHEAGAAPAATAGTLGRG